MTRGHLGPLEKINYSAKEKDPLFGAKKLEGKVTCDLNKKKNEG